MNRIEYDKVEAVNHSSLDYFLDSPVSFKNYIDKMISEEGKSYYNVGSAIHCLLTEPSLFDDEFLVLDSKEPSSAQQKTFCNDIYNALSNGIDPSSDDFKDIIVISYKLIYSNKNKSDEKIISEAMDLYNKNKDYILYLVEENNKKIISPKELDVVKSCVNSVCSHEFASKLLYDKNDDDIIHYEYSLIEEVNGVKCKSRLDELKIIPSNKEIQLIDIKSTSKNFKDFQVYANEYNYIRQLAFYSMMVYSAIKNNHIISLDDLNDYKMNFYIIVVKTVGNYECRVFDVPSEYIFMELGKVKTILDDIKWHFDNNKWDHEIGYYLNGGHTKIQYYG